MTEQPGLLEIIKDREETIRTILTIPKLLRENKCAPVVSLLNRVISERNEIEMLLVAEKQNTAALIKQNQSLTDIIAHAKPCVLNTQDMV